MATQGRNEGFRVLEDFVTEAIRGDDGSPVGSEGRGVSAGMRVVAEPARGLSVPHERIAELRGLSTAQLLALVHDSGPDLSGAELLAIHDIAAERSSSERNPRSESAVELSREVMLAAVNKGA